MYKLSKEIAKATSEQKRLELDETKRMEASIIAYECLILQHASLKCILEAKYDQLIKITESFEKSFAIYGCYNSFRGSLG